MRCKHNDCGWCYHPDAPEPHECKGMKMCDILIAEAKRVVMKVKMLAKEV